MAKYINKDKFFTKLDTIGNPDSEFATDDYIDGFSDGVSAAIRELEKMPAADVAPVVRSKDCIFYSETLNELSNKTNKMEESTMEKPNNQQTQETIMKDEKFSYKEPPSEVELKLAKDLLSFESDYDPYGFADSTKGYENDLANEIQQLRNDDGRRDITNYLQEVIANAVLNPHISTECHVSCAKKLIEDIAEYEKILINSNETKSNVMEEKTMENQNNQQTQESTAKYFNKHSYGEIENKAFLSCDAKTAYAIGQKAQEQGITFSAKYDGDKSSIVVDGVKDKTFVDAVKAEFKVHTADDPTFFNSRAYKDIENKAFISCDSKTAYAIGQKAQEQGITFSAKYDGNKSSIVVDGVKDKAFVDAVKAEFKVHTADDPTFFNSRAYKDIENKAFLSCDAKTAYAISQKAQEQGITFSAKYDGDKSSIVVDGVKDKAFIDAVKAEFKIHTADEPTFFNKKEYKNIENKEFLNTDAKTAYAIGQKAQEQGVTFSAKFNGDKSTVTVDGVKDKAFVDAVKAEFNISDKLDDVTEIADKISDAIDSGEIGKEEHSVGQER